jgi:ectoine hydroxylase-related dioxygenase (phytanoyl-CoA dioxygenase family)
MALYLDPVRRDSGALRVIPGSHQWGDGFADGLHTAIHQKPPEATFGVAPEDVPAVALESQPGDVVVMHQTCKHASFGGNSASTNPYSDLTSQCYLY